MILKKNTISILLIILFLIISIYFSNHFTIENIKHNKLLITGFINNNYLLSVLLFYMSCIIFINSPVPFAALIKILGGFFFGFFMGALYNITATILACLTGFLVSRHAFKESFEKIYYERLRKVENEIEENGFYYFLSLRLAMVVPYFLINIIAGISRISFKKYFFSTIIGVIPASIIYANGGNRLERINSVTELFRTETILSLIIIVFVSFLPLVIKKLNPKSL